MLTSTQGQPAAAPLLNHTTDRIYSLRGYGVQAVAINYHQQPGEPAMVAIRTEAINGGGLTIPLAICRARDLARALLECAEVAEQHSQTERQALDAAIDRASYDSAISDLVGLTP